MSARARETRTHCVFIAKKLKAKREKLQKLIQCEQERNEKILKLEASATAKLSLVRGFDVQQIIPRALR